MIMKDEAPGSIDSPSLLSLYGKADLATSSDSQLRYTLLGLLGSARMFD